MRDSRALHARNAKTTFPSLHHYIRSITIRVTYCIIYEDSFFFLQARAGEAARGWIPIRSSFFIAMSLD